MSSTDEQIKYLKRWIQASIVKVIRPLLGDGITLFVEGEDRPKGTPKHAELRIDGPHLRTVGSKGEYQAEIIVNLVGDSTRNESNIYDRQNLAGTLQWLLNRDFCIYRVGNTKAGTDDGSLVDVMLLQPSEQIKLSDFGQTGAALQLYQCVAEAFYIMTFTLDGS
jgi:hypothetical protein